MSLQPPAAATSPTGKRFLVVAHPRRYTCRNEPSSFGRLALASASASQCPKESVAANGSKSSFCLIDDFVYEHRPSVLRLRQYRALDEKDSGSEDRKVGRSINRNWLL